MAGDLVGKPKVGKPVPSERGFYTYGGAPIPTVYGHEITVQESSASDGPGLWLYVSDSIKVSRHNPHLDLEQVLMLHAALGQFIEDVPQRWTDGEKLIAAARNAVFGYHKDESS